VVGLVHHRKWKYSILAVVVFLSATVMTISPWLLRNYGLLGSPTFSTLANHNLLFYNAVSLEADRHGLGENQVRAEMQERTQQELRQRGWLGNRALEHELYGAWAREIILQHPFRYAYVHMRSNLNSLLPNVNELTELLGVTVGGKGTLSILNQFGLWRAVEYYFDGQLWVLWLLLPFIVLLALTYWGMLAGIVTLVHRRAWWPLVLLLLTVAYFLLIPGAPSNPRFRAPVMPYICLLAGTGFVASWQWLTPLRKGIRQRFLQPPGRLR
jgi:hypothetical protein